MDEFIISCSRNDLQAMRALQNTHHFTSDDIRANNYHVLSINPHLMDDASSFEWICITFKLAKYEIETFINSIWNPRAAPITKNDVLKWMQKIGIRIEPEVAQQMFTSACECAQFDTARWIHRNYDLHFNSGEIAQIFQYAYNHNDTTMMSWLCDVFGRERNIPEKKYFEKHGIKR